MALAFLVVGLLGLPAAAAAQAHGGTNTGYAGSRCAASSGDARFTPPGGGVKTTGLGADAPAYYEIGAPMGTFTGKAPKAIMIVIHGGGWYLVGKEILALWGRPLADRWRMAGWKTINIDYRACGQSVHDVLWFMERVRALHPNAVICATGSSAGGHLAMMLAVRRPDLACAISHAGPSDLVNLERQFAVNASGQRTQAGPHTLRHFAGAAFGATDALNAYSPRRFAGNIRARMLLATGRTDPLIPRAQDAAFARALRAARPGSYVDLLSLPPGPRWFVHTGVSMASLQELRVREDALVAPLVAPRQTRGLGI